MKKHSQIPFDNSYSRRKFLRDISYALGATTLALPSLPGMAQVLNNPSEKTQEALQSGRKLGIALVGLGKYSTGQLAPALQETKLCKLTGIVTGSPEKIDNWKRKYNIPDKNVYNYQNFDKIKDNPDIDIVYVVLPNSMHAEYTIRAAQAGKHVISEKPMATSVKDCKAMIDACEKAGKKLSIGYRLHFEPHNLEMMRLGQKEVYGRVNKIIADDGFPIGNDASDKWRIDKELSGGGPLMDVGIYCVQGAIYTKGQIPVSVTAKFADKKNPGKFKEVEEAMSWQMQFADGSVADCRTSYVENMNRLRAEAAKGWFELDPAFGYGGLKGKTSEGPMNIQNVNQQALQMDDFADCIINNKKTPVPGEMGLRDVQILEAIYRAAETGNKVSTKDAFNIVDLVSKR